MKPKKNRWKILLLCLLIFAAAGSAGYGIIAWAIIDETNSVHIKAGDIENSTIIIGTHLIYLGSMNDSIYQTAVKSAEQSGQYQRYYKSELSDGVWFDITDASALADITTAGTPAPDSVIEELNMTHHTKSDGITYDLVTGGPVNIFDITDPYKPEGLEELNPIKLQYDNMTANEDKTETDERNILLVADFYKEDRTNEFTKQCDSEITALQAYYEILVRDEAEPAMSDRVQTVMEKVDAARRATVLDMFQNDALDQLIKKVNRNVKYGMENLPPPEEEPEEDEEGEEGGDEKDSTKLEDFYVDNNLLSAISEALANVQESYTTYSSKMLAEGTTILSAEEYRASVRLIEYAAKGDYASCDGQVAMLLYLDNINGGTIGKRDEERSYIEQTLIPAADAKYRSSLTQGTGAEYKALPSTAAAATKQSVLKSQKSDTEAVRTELQFILQARIDRMDLADSIEFVKTRIDESGGFRTGIRNDDYAPFAGQSVDSYIEWLNAKLSELMKKQGGGEMDSLQEKKKELQDQRLAALDQNNLAEAKRLDAEIEAVDKQIGALESALNEVLNSSTATAAEKAEAAAGLGSGTASAALHNMAADTLSDIRNGDLDAVGSGLEAIGALAGMNPEAALSALKDIYKELGNQKLTQGEDPVQSDKLDELLNKVEDVTAEQINNFVKKLPEDDIAALVAAFMGIDETAAGDGTTGDGTTGDGTAGDGTTGDGTAGDGTTGDGTAGDGTTGDGTAGDKTAGDGTDGAGAGNLAGILSMLDGSDRAAVLAAIDMYAKETGAPEAEKAVLRCSGAEYGKGTPEVFKKLNGSTGAGPEYAPLDALAKVVGYRYIFNDSQKKVTLQKGGSYYGFTAFEIRVERPAGVEDELAQPAGFQSTVYVEKDYVSKNFSVDTVYLNSSDYGVLLDAQSMETALELFNYLMEMGGDV